MIEEWNLVLAMTLKERLGQLELSSGQRLRIVDMKCVKKKNSDYHVFSTEHHL